MSNRNTRSARVVKGDNTAPEATAPEATSTELTTTPPEATEAEGNSQDVPADAPQPETAEAPQADPFAELPTLTIGEYEVLDLNSAPAELNGLTYKYDAIHKASVDAKSIVKQNWKHKGDMLVLSATGRRDWKEGTVYGTIANLLSEAGRSGLPAYVVVSKLRRLQIGNKRSKYCTGLPAIGWGEGWVDTFVSKGYAKVMATPAPALTVAAAAELVEAQVEAEQEGEKIAANG